MKSLIYEQFSGVGLCNQLFSFETAIYLANITNRKLKFKFSANQIQICPIMPLLVNPPV